MEQALAPVIHGVLTSILAVIMLSTSPFEFIVRHFFWLLLSVMIIGAVNGLFFFPILLSLIGPGAEVIPLNNPNRISTPSPPPIRNRRTNSSSSSSKSIYTNPKKSYSRTCSKPHHHHSSKHTTNNEPSLTTITEEPQSWQSSASSMSSIYDKHDNPELQSIVVQPEVTVETHHQGGDHQNTKVTATANIKVELIAPGRARAYHTSTSSS